MAILQWHFVVLDSQLDIWLILDSQLDIWLILDSQLDIWHFWGRQTVNRQLLVI